MTRPSAEALNTPLLVLVQKCLAAVRGNAVPVACGLMFFALGAVLSAQTYDNVSAQAPPGTVSTTIMSVMSWMMWIFGIVGACLLLWALATAAKHPGEGMWRVISGVVCLILCGSLFSIVNFIYHPGS